MIDRNYYFVALAMIGGLFASAETHAQTKNPTEIMSKIERNTVSGTVLGEDGEPLIGATIMVKGTTDGTAADLDGNFSLLLRQPKATLVISYVGYEQAELPVDLSKESEHGVYVRVTLQPSSNMMQEVVVTGYQSLKRESATGSFQTINAKDLDTRSTSDLASRLEGTVPGLVMDPRSNSKDEDAFTIRGKGTFNAKSSPLVVVDGLPIEGGLSTINPYDIENITVLKDAAAASIYGARASNGVLVVTTKQAKAQRLQVDVNADVTVSELKDYSNYGWATAAQMIELERHNFNAMLNEEGQPTLTSVLTDYDNNKVGTMSNVMRLFLANQRGIISDSELNSTLARWSNNDYRREFRDVHDRTRVSQLYNVSLRYHGNALRSSLNVSYSQDNMGVRRENGSSLTFKYRGDLDVCKWLDLSFGVNVVNNRDKTHDLGSYGYINSFLPYQSMYDDYGVPAGMEAGIYPGYAAFSNPAYELKNPLFNLVDEMGRNFNKYRYTNTRTHIHANFNLLPGWKAAAQFQYEDIYSRSQTMHEAESFFMRDVFNRYTTSSSVMEWATDTSKDWWGADFDMDAWMNDPDHYGMMQVERTQTTHNVPDGGSLETTTVESQFYTFRAQTSYNNTIDKHMIDAVAGFEYRQTHTTTDMNVLLGYDDATQSNLNLLANWNYINNPTTGVFGSDVPVFGAPSRFYTSDELHRFYSIYFVGSYVYDTRYSVSGSYRIDKTDLFGTDPKFRGRPLWSVGLSWNAHNEEFMRNLTWINALKVRGSYGLAGNIDSNSTSYLTAKITTNHITGGKSGTLQTPPNDQLRWEKTSTWNFGLDFSLFNYRLNGSFDYYHKSGSDLLTVTDLDCTTGWSSLTINSGCMVNDGVELMLDGTIIPQTNRKSIGVRLGFNFAYNHNKVTSVSHDIITGVDYLNGSNLHVGYPLGSLFSFDYTGLKEVDGLYYMGWRDKNGEEHTSSIASSEFTKDDVIYSGPTIPVYTGSLTPTVMWNGFALSAMMSYYGGHYMRIGNDEWTTSPGSAYGYNNTFGQSAVSAAALNYWNGDTTYPANGFLSKNYKYMNYAVYRNSNVVHADYMKIRNIMLSYNFDSKICKKIGFNDLRLRFQMNNIATWARNSRNLDPEAISGGMHIDKTPRSYTFSLFFSL